MTFGNLATRPDLQPLFGPLSPEENGRLLNRLLAVDARLRDLALRASAHVGAAYEAVALGYVLGHDGSSAGIHGGPSGPAGDIWFDISPGDPDPGGKTWEVESRIVVFCCDSPEYPGDANTHDILLLRGRGRSAADTLGILEAQVSAVEDQLERIPRERYTNSRHADLP